MRKSITVIGLLSAAAIMLLLKERKPASTAVPARDAVEVRPSMPRGLDNPVLREATRPAIPGVPAAVVETIDAVLSAPIAFYGRVQDQHGRPVAGAKVRYIVSDKIIAAGSEFNGTSDQHGNFAISGLKGAALTVSVGKSGYDPLTSASAQSFGYGMPPDSVRKEPPTSTRPAIFVLRRKAAAEPLVVLYRRFQLGHLGEALEIDLATGNEADRGRGHIKIECWRPTQPDYRNPPWPWKCRISVPGGGLRVRPEEEDGFEAPASGYEAEIWLPRARSDGRWVASDDAEYWLKLKDGTYARIRCDIGAGQHTQANITSYWNPSGSRNLECDPALQRMP